MKKLSLIFLGLILVTTSVMGLAQPASAAGTLEDEINILDQYIDQAPKMPRGSVKSTTDVTAIKLIVAQTQNLQTIEENYPYMSSKSLEMFAQIPLFIKELNKVSESLDTSSIQYKAGKVKIFKGKTYASYKYKYKIPGSRKWISSELIFIKENGVWKFDFVQMFKDELR